MATPRAFDTEAFRPTSKKMVVPYKPHPGKHGEGSHMSKEFKIPGDRIREIVKIPVEGQRVRFMYREEPDNDVDSGWRFMAGTESDAYMNDPRNHAFYDVITIANYDPDILPFLDAPIGSAFERPVGDTFIEVVDWDPPRD